MAQFKADIDIYTSNDDGPRPLTYITWFVLHTSQGLGSHESLARYQQNPKAGGSYQLAVDDDNGGKSARENDDNYIPWAAGFTGNKHGLHVAIVGFAEWTREQWLSHDDSLNTVARILWNAHVEYGIELRKLTVPEVKSKKVKGICGHDDISKAFGEVNHWDPGPNFPYDVLIFKALNFGNPKALAPSPVPILKEQSVSTPDLVLDQLGGLNRTNENPFPGWPRWCFAAPGPTPLEEYNKGLTLVDLIRSVDREVNSWADINDRANPESRPAKDTLLGHVWSTRAELRELRGEINNLTAQVEKLTRALSEKGA